MMSGLLKQSTAFNAMVLMIDSSDHITGKAGLSLTITASKDGGAFASISPTVTDLGNGWYNLALTTTHTNTKGVLALHITGTGADPKDPAWQVVTDLPGDTVASVSGAVGSVTGAVGSVTGAVGSVTGNVGGSVASVTGNVGGNVVGSVASVTGNVGGNVVGSVASVTAGVTLAASAITAIWDKLTSALTTVGSIGKLLADNIDATISSRNSTTPPTVTAIRTEMDSNSTKLANLDATISSRLASASYTAPDNTSITAIKAKTDNLPASPASEGNVTSVKNLVISTL